MISYFQSIFLRKSVLWGVVYFIQCLELSMMVCCRSKLSLCNTGRASHSSYQCSLISFTDIKLQ